MATDSNNIKQKISNVFCCENCDYYTDRKSNIRQHFMSARHVKATNSNENKQVLSEIIICEKCNKTYKDRTGLWRHKKKCNKNDNSHEETNTLVDTESIDKDQLIIMLIEQNSVLIKETSEFKNIILEIVKKDTTINNNITNSHNKSFNLNFFLNETCKDAMNIMDFVDSIKLQLTDLENVGKLGYVEGISNIITTNLKALDVTQRPIHCADKKREVVYVKDDNKWEKEDGNKKKIRKAIKRVVFKNQRLIPSFKEAHPDCLKSASKFSDQYNKIIVESMGGSGDNDEEKEDKIIRNISKHVIIDK